MRAPICADCHLEMKICKTGELVEEMMNATDPYKLWFCDRFRCDLCGHEVLAGFGEKPYGEHFQKPSYDKKREESHTMFWSDSRFVSEVTR